MINLSVFQFCFEMTFDHIYISVVDQRIPMLNSFSILNMLTKIVTVIYLEAVKVPNEKNNYIISENIYLFIILYYYL